MSVPCGYVEYVLGIYSAMLVDIAEEYPVLTHEFKRDFKRLSSAIEHHGLWFVLETMPQYRKHFDKCLDAGRLTRSSLLHMKPWKPESTVPRLFKGLMLRVFDSSGELLADPDVRAVRHLRELYGVFRKLRLPCSDAAVRSAVDEYIEIDRSLPSPDLDWSNAGPMPRDLNTKVSLHDHPNIMEPWRCSPSYTRSGSDDVCDLVLLDFCQRTADIVIAELGLFDPHRYRFRHGPGVVADQRFDTDKYQFQSPWSHQLEVAFPYADFAVANYACVDATPIHEDASFHASARLIAVPKTISKPRLIASEPTSHQWCQQSIRDFMYSRVKETFLGKFIKFDDQTINATLALQASSSRSLATVDLSAASDRLSCWVVERLFRQSPSLLTAMKASRSSTVEQDICSGHSRIIYLRKYSSMGNATTFPVESVSFLIMALAACLRARGLRPSIKNIRSFKDKVHVFGDDVVIPTDALVYFEALLHSLHLKVNIDKTFNGIAFRESCGVDACLGQDVTSANVLDVPRRTGPGSVVSSVDTANNFFQRGYYSVSRYIQRTVNSLGYKIPYTEDGSGLFGWQSFEGRNSHLKLRWNRDLQRVEMKCHGITVKTFRRVSQTHSSLLQFFTEAAKMVTSSTSTIGYQTRRPKASLNLRWVPFSPGHLSFERLP